MSMNILLQRQTETIIDTSQKLAKYGRCAILRMTGFGKTTVMCQIANTYRRILWVYPTEAARQAAEKVFKQLGRDLSTVDFSTYTKLGKYNTNTDEFKEILSNKNYSLIVFDEIHHMGAKNVKIVLDDVLKSIDTSKVHILGSTATPKRMDGFDVIGEYFLNSLTFFYGLDLAIKDGIIPKSLYVYAADSKAVNNRLNKTIKSIPEKYQKKYKLNIRSIVGQLANVSNAPDLLKEGINKAHNNNIPTYMKFIVFFSTQAVLTVRAAEMFSWFKEAFPNHKLRTITVHSGNSAAKNNVNKLDTLKAEPNTIDLILSINMLNEGIHLDNMTGVVLLRPTQSSIVYTQQVGRCMQVGMKYTPVIFDFVDNINTSSIFDLDTTSLAKTPQSYTTAEQIERLHKLEKDNIILIDQIATVREYISKIEQLVPRTIEDKILELRTGKIAYPAHVIAKELGIHLWEVLRILDKHHDELEKLELQKCEQDYWTNGDMIFGERIDLEK